MGVMIKVPEKGQINECMTLQAEPHGRSESVGMWVPGSGDRALLEYLPQMAAPKLGQNIVFLQTSHNLSPSLGYV